MAYKLIDIVGLDAYTRKLKAVIDTKADDTSVRDLIDTKADQAYVDEHLALKQDQEIEPMQIADTVVQSVTEALSTLNDKKVNWDDVDNSLSGISTNPVQNKVIKAAIDAIVGGQGGIIYTDVMPVPPNIQDAIYGVGTTNITFYMGNSVEQTLTPLSGLVADGALSETSINPVQNKVITAALNTVVTAEEVDELFED